MIVGPYYYYPTGKGTKSAASAATTSWTGGAGNGAWTNAGNWDNGVPTSSDTAVVGATNDTIAAIDQSAVDLAALHIMPGFGGTITSLDINAAKVTINNPGPGTINLTGTFTHLYVLDTGQQPGALTVENANLSITKIINAYVIGGRVAFSGSIRMDNLYCLTPTGQLAYVTTGSSIASVSSQTAPRAMLLAIRINPGAALEGETGAESVTAYGGRLTGDGFDVASSFTIGDGAAIDAGGNLGVMTCYPNSSMSLNAPSQTRTIDTITAYPNAKIDLRNGLGGPDISNGITDYGGRIIYESGRAVTVA